MLNFDKDILKSTYLLGVLIVVFIALAFILPIEYSYENHFLENLEVVILFIGIIICINKIKKIEVYSSMKFYISAIFIYLLMIGRELSWGRVFYPVGIDEHGEQIFVKVHELWYGEFVYPIVGLLIVVAIMLLGYFLYQSRKEGIRWNIPLWEFLVFTVMSILSQCVFDRGLFEQWERYNQLLEECTEILAYIALVFCTYNISFQKIYIRIKYFNMI